MPRPTRIAILNSHPIQYFAPLYAYLNTAPDLELTALYLSDLSIRGGKDAGFGQDIKWDLDLLAGYPSLFLGNARTREPGGFWSLVAPEVWRGKARRCRSCSIRLGDIRHRQAKLTAVTSSRDPLIFCTMG